MQILTNTQGVLSELNVPKYIENLWYSYDVWISMRESFPHNYAPGMWNIYIDYVQREGKFLTLNIVSMMNKLIRILSKIYNQCDY